MNWRNFEAWLNSIDLTAMALLLFGAMCLAALLGIALQRLPRGRDRDADSSQEGYVVSATLGLLALLLGFTFAMATDRFDSRRALVVEEANAIGTAYLRAQLLPEPHRARTSGLLLRYSREGLARRRRAATTAGRQRRAADGHLGRDQRCVRAHPGPGFFECLPRLDQPADRPRPGA
jgi:hypothetical protein